MFSYGNNPSIRDTDVAHLSRTTGTVVDHRAADQQIEHYRGFVPAARPSLAYLATSARMKAANSSGVSAAT